MKVRDPTSVQEHFVLANIKALDLCMCAVFLWLSGRALHFPPRSTSQRKAKWLSRGLPRKLSPTRQTRCESRRQCPPWGRKPWMVWVRSGAPPPLHCSWEWADYTFGTAGYGWGSDWLGDRTGDQTAPSPLSSSPLVLSSPPSSLVPLSSPENAYDPPVPAPRKFLSSHPLLPPPLLLSGSPPAHPQPPICTVWAPRVCHPLASWGWSIPHIRLRGPDSASACRPSGSTWFQAPSTLSRWLSVSASGSSTTCSTTVGWPHGVGSHPSSMAPPSVFSTVDHHHGCGLGPAVLLLLRDPPISSLAPPSLVTPLNSVCRPPPGCPSSSWASP